MKTRLRTKEARMIKIGLGDCVNGLKRKTGETETEEEIDFNEVEKCFAAKKQRSERLQIDLLKFVLRFGSQTDKELFHKVNG